ncbi:MAG TPA: hypothetical protein VKE96_23810 [Vicinamibacterales bacterium]|nr:hypothetical protein [Vicinamibacterales bacterium]
MRLADRGAQLIARDVRNSSAVRDDQRTKESLMVAQPTGIETALSTTAGDDAART